jgi:Transposase and inactivated derivatives
MKFVPEPLIGCCLGTLPPGDDDFSNRWKAIKIRFVQKIPAIERRSKVRTHKGERGIYPRAQVATSFLGTCQRNERDYANHINYVHVNPLKHGYVTRVKSWPYSSFHRYVREGVLPADWGGDFAFDADTDFGERPYGG